MAVKDEAFNNIFYIFHKYENVCSGKDFKCVKHPTLRFTNTAALVDF
ncbi:BPI-like_protein [Hexamita inflata]|uniref:BPI-like protein n=1 Tax=Hexamita inflata TaxID=28002 RepID=A0AA86PA51_9EUKA|nr:BPI-like protein [Hexamita inflata]